MFVFFCVHVCACVGVCVFWRLCLSTQTHTHPSIYSTLTLTLIQLLHFLLRNIFSIHTALVLHYSSTLWPYLSLAMCLCVLFKMWGLVLLVLGTGVSATVTHALRAASCPALVHVSSGLCLVRAQSGVGTSLKLHSLSLCLFITHPWSLYANKMAFVPCHCICITVLVFSLFSLPFLPYSLYHPPLLHVLLIIFFTLFFLFFPPFRLSFFIAASFSTPPRLSPSLWCVARHRVWTPGLRWMTPSATGSWTSPVFHPGWQERMTFFRVSSTKSSTPKRSIIRAKVRLACNTHSPITMPSFLPTKHGFRHLFSWIWNFIMDSFCVNE